MIDLSERQTDILRKLIEEYTCTAEPVSSGLLCKKFDFGVSAATIRIELGRLSDQGYITQPYTSAGRMPTDKGYRFFVDRLDNGDEEDNNLKEITEILEKDLWQRMLYLSRFIAENISVFALSGVPEKSFFAGAGWTQILEQPEFEEKEVSVRFARLIREIEKGVKDREGTESIEVFIGTENPFCSFEEFSVIMTRCSFREGKGIISLAGPKRMPYGRNISVLRRIKSWMKRRQ